MNDDITFVRLTAIPAVVIAEHMSDPRVAAHLPLLKTAWDTRAAEQFVALKEQRWDQDGLGHWAILAGGDYVGWGGFQKEKGEWDFGLVLRPDHFGLGRRVTKKALELAKADARIPYVTFLLPPSRTKLGALARLGARHVGEVVYDGETFLKYRLETV